ncbi:hypothetical protein [Winogradskyella sp. UBA3174]|uniref:hypothetical protein n=1 Tax=Winogradskyella sp. UBA3174 TaxID=1947785 RepID=UPI0025DB7E6E|nr:hypothetical protein [Winogradskyella sp. UBA3174]
MKEFAKLYKLSFYCISLLIFLLGGFFQYFFGLSNTILTFGITAYLFFVSGLYFILKNRIVLNSIVLYSISYIFLIYFSGLINGSNFLATNIYLIFPLLPLSVFLFCYINYKECFISNTKIYSFFLKIGLVQLPILLLQSNFYDFLIQFNFSGKQIDWYDFMFGTFFIKSDHSLSIFLVFLVLIIILNKDGFRDKLKFPFIIIGYLSVTVYIAESNISKAFLTIFLFFSFIIPLYKKYRHTLKFKLVILFSLAAFLISVNQIKDAEFIKKRFGGSIERQFSIAVAQKQYDLKNAKRSQILIVVINNLERKWIGDGPYSYFDIFTGKFNYTKHFTQIIWSYFDLGLLGIFIVLGYLRAIIKYLDIKKGIPKLIFFGFLLTYTFYTTIYSDIAIIFSMFIIFNKKNSNELNNYSFSRLEKE